MPWAIGQFASDSCSEPKKMLCTERKLETSLPLKKKIKNTLQDFFYGYKNQLFKQFHSMILKIYILH